VATTPYVDRAIVGRTRRTSRPERLAVALAGQRLLAWRSPGRVRAAGRGASTNQERAFRNLERVQTVSVNAADVRAKLEPFGQRDPGSGSVRDEIAILRAQRDAGELTHTDWSVRVAELLGAVEVAPLAASPLSAW
jgi:hypothetical protein